MKKVSVVLLIAGLLFLSTCDIAPAQTIPERKIPNSGSQLQSAFHPIAIGRQRISREKQTIAISRGNCDVLRPAGGRCLDDVVSSYFTDLVIAKMADDFSLFARNTDPQKLNGMAVSLARDPKVPDRWNILSGGASDAENVFRIRQVVSSTEKDQVRLQIDGRVYTLEPGEVLLLLG